MIKCVSSQPTCFHCISAWDQNQCCLGWHLVLFCFFKRKAHETCMSKMDKGVALLSVGEKTSTLSPLFCSAKILNPGVLLMSTWFQTHSLRTFIFFLWGWLGRLKPAAFRASTGAYSRKLGLSSPQVSLPLGKKAHNRRPEGLHLFRCSSELKLPSKLVTFSGSACWNDVFLPIVFVQACCEGRP